MADNLNITEGTGTTIKTDDVGGVHYQQVKLVDGTLEGTGVIAADIGVKANALRIVPANNITDGTYIGDIKFGESLPANTNTQEVVGDVAHSAVDAGNPVKVGGKAVNTDGTVPGTVVTENDVANFITDLYGRQCVDTVHPNFWSVAATYAGAQTNTEIKATPGAGLSLYITDIVVSNGATAGNIKFVESTAVSPVDKIEIMYFAINGGAALHFRTPIKLTADKNFGITSVTCTTHSVTINGYIAP